MYEEKIRFFIKGKKTKRNSSTKYFIKSLKYNQND